MIASSILSLFFLHLFVNFTDACECRSADFSTDVSTGEFKSPGYPVSYCMHLDCIYRIDGVEGKSVHLFILSLDIEFRHDFLEIHETFFVSGSLYSAKVATLTGNQIVWPMLISSVGSGFNLRFTTDESDHFSGFYGKFARVNASIPGAACPQFFHEAIIKEQELSSPPISFHHPNARCVYMINTTLGYVVELKIKSISTAVVLTIYETENFASITHTEYLAKLQGPRFGVPVNITSRTESIIILMKVKVGLMPFNFYNNTQQFAISFKRSDTPCKCSNAIHTIKVNETVELISPGYPIEYCNLIDCRMDIEIFTFVRDKTLALVLRFNDFHTESNADFLYIRAKYARLTHLLFGITGNMENSMYNYFTFGGPTLQLHFYTDATIASTGYNITVTGIERKPGCECLGNEQPFLLNLKSGNLSFKVNENCFLLDCFFDFRTTNLESVPTSTSRFILNLTYSFKNGDEEFFEIWPQSIHTPSQLNDSTDIFIEAGTTSQGSHLIMSEEPMTLWYHLATSERDEPTYINLTYEWREKCICGPSLLTANVGTWKEHTSPDYPVNYCNNMLCTYTIKAPDGYIVSINVTDVSLEPHEDFLMFFDGPTQHEKRIRSISGIEIFEATIQSTQPVVFVRFVSDQSVSHRGFAFLYSAEKEKQANSSETSVLFIIILIILLALLVSILAIAYQKNLLCFSALSKKWWRMESAVGFTNLMHENSY